MSIDIIIMSDPEGYYEVLGLKPGASSAEIKRAYRRRSLETHPDRNKDSQDATAQFQKVSAAYNVLGDEEQKAIYDAGGGQGMPFPMGGGSPDDIMQFFAQNLFGGGAHPQFFHVHGDGGQGFNFHHAMRKPTPIIKTITITLEKAFTGCKIPIEIERWVTDAAGRHSEKETLYVTVPEGIDDNEIIILREKGNSLSESNRGDVKIFIKVSNTTDFQRTALDLVYSKTLTLQESLCGFSFDMEHIDGRTFKINNGNGNVISPGYKKMIPKLGMKRDGHQGNLIIDFTVVFPEKLSSEQIEKIKDVFID